MAFFRAISSFFSASSRDDYPVRNARRQQAISSTQDAFSLPQHSPSIRNSFSRSSSTESPLAFTYPPRRNSDEQGRSSSDRIEGSRMPYSEHIFPEERGIASTRHTSHLLPLHRTPASPLPPYPPLQQTWARLHTWLSNEFTELGDTLNYGVTPDVLVQVENHLGVALPAAVRDSYLVVDGQEPESSSGCSEGLFFGLSLMPLEDVLAEWSFWREVDHDPTTGANEQLRAQMRSVPPNWIKREYSWRGWLPLVTDHAGNYLGVDLDPGEGGTYGQVIIFGRDFDTKVVLYRGEGGGGWATWLASFVDDLESGAGFELTGQQSDGASEGSDDNAGYEGYFFNPSGGARGHGGADGGQTMRLNGTYKGWNVLDAWWDKSVRAWTQMGLGIEAQEEEPPYEEPNARPALSVLTMQASSGAEVPIPVLGEDEAAQLASPTREGPFRPAAPPIDSVVTSSALPPPRPIELPTRSDINKQPLFAPLLVESSTSAPTQDAVELGLSGYEDNEENEALQVLQTSRPIRDEPRGGNSTSAALLHLSGSSTVPSTHLGSLSMTVSESPTEGTALVKIAAMPPLSDSATVPERT